MEQDQPRTKTTDDAQTQDGLEPDGPTGNLTLTPHDGKVATDALREVCQGSHVRAEVRVEAARLLLKKDKRI